MLKSSFPIGQVHNSNTKDLAQYADPSFIKQIKRRSFEYNSGLFNIDESDTEYFKQVNIQQIGNLAWLIEKSKNDKVVEKATSILNSYKSWYKHQIK
jgi:adenine-specific DNA methylase